MGNASSGGLAYVTAGGGGAANAPALSISGNTAGVVGIISSGTANIAGGNNITLSQNGQSLTIIGGAGGAGFSAGVSGGNTAGSTGLTGTNLYLFGGNNVTLSQSTGPSGATVSIIGTQTVQTQASGNIGATGFATTTSAGSVIAGTNNTAGFTLGVPAFLTTQSVQTQASGAIAATGFATTTIAGSTVAGTLNTAGMTLAVPAFLTTQSVQTQASGAIAATGFATTTIAGSTVGGTLNTAGMTLAVPAYLTTQSVQTQASGNIPSTGFATTTAAGSVIAGTNNTNGFTLGVPAFLTTQSVQTQASGNIAGVGTTVTGGASITLNSGGLLFNGSGLAGTTTAITGNASITLNSAGLQFNGAGLAGTGTSATNASITLNSAGLQISVGAGGGGNFSGGVSNLGNSAGNTGVTGTQLVFVGSNNITLSQTTGAGGGTISIIGGGGGGATTDGLFATGNTTNNTTATMANSSYLYNFQGGITGGFSQGGIQISGPAISSISATGQLSLVVNASTISLGVAAAGTAFSTTSGATGVNLTGAVNTAGMTLSVPYLTRMIYPQDQLVALNAPGNASLSIQYVPVDVAVTGTRVDALMGMSFGSSATTNTGAVAMSMYFGIYSRTGNTLTTLSSGSTQTTFSYASNTAGQTQLTMSALRPISAPINFNMAPGEYFVGVNLITATSSIGLSTTNMGNTMSIYGATNVQTALPYAELNVATATNNNLWKGQGMYSVATTGMPTSIGLVNINATGSAQQAANIAIVFRAST
jgi:hypothetical protein